jgi:hypothetical protein
MIFTIIVITLFFASLSVVPMLVESDPDTRKASIILPE